MTMLRAGGSCGNLADLTAGDRTARAAVSVHSEGHESDESQPDCWDQRSHKHRGCFVTARAGILLWRRRVESVVAAREVPVDHRIQGVALSSFSVGGLERDVVVLARHNLS